jgi:DNA replication protein DnaC
MYLSRKDTPPREHVSNKSLAIIGIPRLYFDAELEDYEGGSKFISVISNYIENIHDVYDNCVNLTLYGSNGSGKTFITSIILKNAYRRYYTVRRILFSEFISKVFNSKKNFKEEQEIETIYNAEFLVIDELGKESDTKSGAHIDVLIHLLKHREEKGFPTIISTNLDIEGIQQRYGETVHSLVSQSIPIKMTGSDRRKDVFKNKSIVNKILGREG